MRQAQSVSAKPVSCSSSSALVPSCIPCQRKYRLYRRSQLPCCQGQGDGRNVTSALCGVGVALLLANPAEAGLLSYQQYGSPTVANPRALVLDRQRVEALLANEFKERLHALSNDQLVQMLDELLESQQTTAPELFEDVLGRQLETNLQQAQPQSGVGQQLAAGVRQGLAQLWGFSQSSWQQVRPLPANPDSTGSSNAIAKESAATGTTARDEARSSGDAELSPTAPSAVIGSSSGVEAGGGQRAASVSRASSPDSMVAGPRQKLNASKSQPELPATVQQPQAEDEKVQQQQRAAGMAAAGDNATAVAGPMAQEVASPKAPEAGASTASGAVADVDGNLSGRNARFGGSSTQQQQQQSTDQAGGVGNEGLFDDLGESDITGGLLFGGPGSGQDLFAPTDSTAAAQAAKDVQNSSSPEGNGVAAAAAAAASKFQGLLQLPSNLLSKIQSEDSSSLQAAAGDAAASSTPAAGAVATAPAVIGAGGVLAGASAAAAAARSGLKELLQVPGEVAETWDAAFEDLRYSAADAVSAVLDEQGATIAAAFALTAAAGGGVLLLSSLLQPLLDGELTKTSKLSAALQQQEGEGEGGGPPQVDVPNSSTGASAAVPATQLEAEAASRSAGTVIGFGEDEEALQLADSEVEAITSRTSGSSTLPILSGLLDNVSSADLDSAASGSAPAVVEDPFSATTATTADGPNILWQRTEQAVPPVLPSPDSPVSATAPAAAATDGVILWQRDAAPIPSAAGDSSSILWQRGAPSGSSPPPPTLSASEEAANSSSSVLWQRPVVVPGGIQQAGPGQKHGTDVQGAADVSSAGGSEWLWSASDILTPAPQQQQQQQQQHPLWDAPTASFAQPRSSSSSSSRQRTRGKDRVLSQLLSNVEDVVEFLPPGSVLPQQPPWQQWQPSPAWPQQRQQQQPSAHVQTHSQQGSSSPSVLGGGDPMSWRPASSNSSSASSPLHIANQFASASSDAPLGAPPRTPRDLWPAILATSSAALSRSSVASADCSELDVSLDVPSYLLSVDPWGTSPPGLQPSLDELQALGVLQCGLQGFMTQAAAACKDALTSESPWSTPAPAAADSGVEVTRSESCDRLSGGANGGPVVHEVAVGPGPKNDHVPIVVTAHGEAMAPVETGPVAAGDQASFVG